MTICEGILQKLYLQNHKEKQMKLIPRCITLDWWPVIFLWEPYFHHFYVVAKMIWWVKNPFFGWILNINYFKKLNIFSDSHMSFKKTHVVISDKRSHIFIVIVLLHQLFCPECVWWNLVCNQIRNRRFLNSNKFGLRLTDNKLKMRYIKLVLWKNVDDLLSKSSDTLQKFSKDVLKTFLCHHLFEVFHLLKSNFSCITDDIFGCHFCEGFLKLI